MVSHRLGVTRELGCGPPYLLCIGMRQVPKPAPRHHRNCVSDKHWGALSLVLHGTVAGWHLARLWVLPIVPPSHTFLYFPISVICLSLHISPSSCCRLNYLLAGGLNPVGFHVLNIILHAVISALMIDVFAILIGGLAYDEMGGMLNHAPKTSILAALFFAAHPVHTESVSRVQL